MRKTVLPQDEMLRLFLPFLHDRGKVFSKKRPVFAKKAMGGERVFTTTEDGLETQNTAQAGDFIVQNQTGASEQYVLSAEKFASRYVWKGKSADGFEEYWSTGKIRAIELTEGVLQEVGLPDEFYFVANWGEPMVAKRGDFLVAVMDFSEVYRASREEFLATYEPVFRYDFTFA